MLKFNLVGNIIKIGVALLIILSGCAPKDSDIKNRTEEVVDSEKTINSKEDLKIPVSTKIWYESRRLELQGSIHDGNRISNACVKNSGNTMRNVTTLSDKKLNQENLNYKSLMSLFGSKEATNWARVFDDFSNIVEFAKRNSSSPTRETLTHFLEYREARQLQAGVWTLNRLGNGFMNGSVLVDEEGFIEYCGRFFISEADVGMRVLAVFSLNFNNENDRIIWLSSFKEFKFEDFDKDEFKTQFELAVDQSGILPELSVEVYQVGGQGKIIRSAENLSACYGDMENKLAECQKLFQQVKYYFLGNYQSESNFVPIKNYGLDYGVVGVNLGMPIFKDELYPQRRELSDLLVSHIEKLVAADRFLKRESLDWSYERKFSLINYINLVKNNITEVKKMGSLCYRNAELCLSSVADITESANTQIVLDTILEEF